MHIIIDKWIMYMLMLFGEIIIIIIIISLLLFFVFFYFLRTLLVFGDPDLNGFLLFGEVEGVGVS